MSRIQRVLKMQTLDDLDDDERVIEGELVEDEGGLDGWLDDLWSAGSKVARDTVKKNSGAASEQLEKALRSSEFGKVLDAVEDKAREGVQKEVAANLPTLVVFTLAGGVIGGTIAEVGGTVGKAAVIGLAVWMGYNLLNKPQAKK